MEKTEIRISGLGGQGVVLAGQILGRAAAYDGKNVVQTQSYGAEARGSMAKSEVIISDSKIGFPIVRKCDILVAMSQDAVTRNIKDLKEEGILLLDSSLKNTLGIKARILRIPATEIAESSCGEKLYANMVMLGALVRVSSIVSEKSMERAIMDSISEKSISANLWAYRKGKKLIN